MHPNILKDVTEFLKLAHPDMIVSPTKRPSTAMLKLAYKLIDEEVNKELLVNLNRILAGTYSLEHAANLLDDIVDSIYVLAWTAAALSMPFDEAWNEVQKANMAKFPLVGTEPIDNMPEGAEASLHIESQRTIYRNKETGKVMKPKNWKAPDIFSIMYEQYRKHYIETNPEVLVERSRRNKNGK